MKMSGQKQYYLLLDSEVVAVGGSFLIALDILFKSHYVFHLVFPDNLLTFWNFFEVNVYNMEGAVARPSVGMNIFIPFLLGMIGMLIRTL